MIILLSKAGVATLYAYANIARLDELTLVNWIRLTI